ncbi:putative homeodomain transcription factor 2 isoform X1 [Bombyx mandarina]|uniref:Homeodomain transcription factor 2 isoform X1 n=1 Tax=Bombyx mandarina TaxID=7092 RepID=A0A6J2JCQ4_BOMMA|nr:putative homeodomain transcription factor 2 isoform X1 [Bombyx mandarina]XP_028027077.1 putative homeodomain transcription factor 2 isoform X1 [Bombyx mandarina]XP_028027078.1 putative homeodomain transcription factor 2 isoform X1 [Bombyx mandarina]
MKQLAAWYQKKISSYDKEEWETMVEQLLMRGTYRRRIVDFSSHARSYLIDVDLVRGSSFPKAKPTLGMRRVVWFALVRLVFLPALFQWWAQQTSPACAKFLLTLWLLQVLNISLYFMSPDNLDVDPNCWLVPLGLMLVLSMVHSQIVSTTEMEIARVRPRSTYRRKLPRYFRRPRSECDGGSAGGSAESGATSSQSKTPTTKPSKFRRRQSRSELGDNGLRKRKKELPKENVSTPLEPTAKNKAIVKLKAKDSDDEDYMAWKKPDINTPIVTFTPPPDDATPSSSFRYKSNILTKKHLESFNVRQNQHRALFADGDDGFESLNGYNSNGSDGDNRVKILQARLSGNKIVSNERNEVTAKDDSANDVDKTPIDKVEENSTTTAKANVLKTEDDEKSNEPDSDVNVTDSPNRGKRIGVRFRSSWILENVRDESSDDDFANVKNKQKKIETFQTSSSDGECSASAPSIALPSHHTMSDWVGQTTNSEESSYCSQSEGGNSDVGFHYAADSSWDPFALLDPTSDTVKCTMWERGSTLRAELSAVDISWYVVARAERAMAAEGCVWAGLAMATIVALLTPAIRLTQLAIDQDTRTEEETQSMTIFLYIISVVVNYSKGSVLYILYGAFGDNAWELMTNIISCILRFALSGLMFFLLAVAERAYKQRFLYAKLFSHLTSARRARKSELPHFRLNTVRNIKTWLSTRSYLRRRGPQRSVDVIVSAAFMLTLILLACVSAHLLRDSVTLEEGWLFEAMVWICCLGIYLLRLITLGSNVNKKYRGCLSAILTEQINLHLAIEQRPESKDQLTVANNVLKLAADLLKELDAPFKISGICANHYLYTVSKVVILSALSGVLSEMLGFKLKLHKIKIK